MAHGGSAAVLGKGHAIGVIEGMILAQLVRFVGSAEGNSNTNRTSYAFVVSA